MNSADQKSISAMFLAILLGISLGANLLLSWRIREVHRSENPTPITGVRLKDFEAVDVDGHPFNISFRNSATTILYLLNPQCHWCARNLANIKTLSTTEGSSLRIIGLSLASPQLKSYASSSGLDFPIYSIESLEPLKAVGAGGTPDTLLVAPGGKVIKHWTGAFSGTLILEIDKYFGVKLPGLLPEATSTAR